MENLAVAYKQLSTKGTLKLLQTESFATHIADLSLNSRKLIHDQTEKLDLNSQVVGKKYFAYRRTVLNENQQVIRVSRPINNALYIEDDEEFALLLKRFIEAKYDDLHAAEITRLIYTIAMSFCAVNDVHKTGDKKTPATFFELLISHIFARQFQTPPRTRVKVPAIEGESAELPTDIWFDLGKGNVKLHVPVKLSTRERVIQAWAHQRVLEGVWGTAEFKGLLVVLNETKLDLKTLNVTEICLPLQWAVYQRYIAQLNRVYYLDVPERYALLALSIPRIDVKPLGMFFSEKDALLTR